MWNDDKFLSKIIKACKFSLVNFQLMKLIPKFTFGVVMVSFAGTDGATLV